MSEPSVHPLCGEAVATCEHLGSGDDSSTQRKDIN